jgi:hypothetical protein
LRKTCEKLEQNSNKNDLKGFRIVNPEWPLVQKFGNSIRKSYESSGYYMPEGLKANKLRVETALAYDSVLLFTETYKQGRELWKHKTLVDCERQNSYWVDGESFSNFMRAVSTLKFLPSIIRII